MVVGAVVGLEADKKRIQEDKAERGVAAPSSHPGGHRGSTFSSILHLLSEVEPSRFPGPSAS